MTRRRDSKAKDGRGSARGGSSLTLRTLGVVTVVSVFTWLLAESQTVQRRTLTLEVRLDPGGEQRAIRMASGESWDGLVELTLDGAAANLEGVRRALRGGVTLTAGEELSVEPGVQGVDLADALLLDPAFAGSGVLISEASPPRVEVELRPVLERLVPVSVELPEGSQAEATVVDPAAVLVRGPEPVLKQVGEAAMVRVPGAIVSDLLPGQSAERVSLGVDVAVPEGVAWGLRVLPERVSVSVTVRNRLDTEVLARVPVQVLMAPSELDRWVIAVSPEDRDIRDVRVTGPAAQVARVTSGDIPLVAVVRLSFEELERGVTVKEAELPRLPGGLSAEADDLTVGLTVRRRADIGGDGAGVGGGPGGGG
ncbi:MAG: hypothetical protein AAGI53_13435 [Planctomycetota bacterium]